MAQRILGTTVPFVQLSEMTMGGLQMGIALQRLLIRGDRGALLASIFKDDTQIEIGNGELRTMVDSTSITGFRLCQLPSS